MSEATTQAPAKAATAPIDDIDRFTLAKMPKERKELIRDALAKGVGIRACARAFGASPSTIMQVRDEAGWNIGLAKQAMSREWANIVGLAQERLRDKLMDDECEVSVQQLSVAAAIGTDKMLVLAGEATSRIAHESAESPQKLKAAIKEALMGARIGAQAEKRRIPTEKVARPEDS